MAVDGRVPERGVQEELHGEEIEPVDDEGHLLEVVSAEQRRRQREQAHEQEEEVGQPDEGPVRAPNVVESNMVPNPKDPEHDEAERVDQDGRGDCREIGQRLVRACTVCAPLRNSKSPGRRTRRG